MANNIPYGGAGGGGQFVTRFISQAITVLSGVSGTIFSITPPAGQKVKITTLTTDTATALETDLTLTVGATTVVSGGSLTGYSGSSGNDRFGIAPGITGAATQTKGFAVDIVGATDETITLSKDTGNTTRDIAYSYQFGE